MSEKPKRKSPTPRDKWGTRPKSGKAYPPGEAPKRTRKCPICKEVYPVVHGHICKK